MDNIEQEEKEQKQIELEDLANKNCLIRVVAGSHAYGTNIEGSDWDERAVFADTAQRIILPFQKIEQVTFREDDKVYYELSKYMPLLLTQNPNVLEILWTAPEDILYISEPGQLLIDNRSEFLSKQVKDKYVGYAVEQLKRIKGHNKWINNPQPEVAPERKDFVSVVYNFTKNSEYNKKSPSSGFTAIEIGNDTFTLWDNSKFDIPEDKSWIDNKGNFNTMPRDQFNKINVANKTPDIIVRFNRDLFEQHHTNWKMYWKWKKNRNEKRSELEDKFGYDVKHAMHLIRLLRSGIDILETGIVPVRRSDAAYLLDIRNGKYTYEEIVKESETLKDKIEVLSKKTNLPDEPNYELAKEIMMEIYKHQWGFESKPTKKVSKNM